LTKLDGGYQTVFLSRRVDSGIPYSESQHRPGQPWLERAVANTQQQRGRVVEAPFVRAPQVAVLDLVREQIERVQAVEERRVRCRPARRRGVESGIRALAGRHGSVMSAERRIAWRSACLIPICRRRVSSVFTQARSLAPPMKAGSARWWVCAIISPRACLASLAGLAVLAVEASLLRRPARDAGDGIAHRVD
jgi:hypothetical protein